MLFLWRCLVSIAIVTGVARESRRQIFLSSQAWQNQTRRDSLAMIHGKRGLTIINRVPARRYVPLHRIAMSVRPRVVLREIAAGVLWANLVQGGMMRGGALFDVVFMSMGR